MLNYLKQFDICKRCSEYKDLEMALGKSFGFSDMKCIKRNRLFEKDKLKDCSVFCDGI